MKGTIKMIKMREATLRIIVLYFMARPCFAQMGIGGVANNLMDPVTMFYKFITSGCILIGGGFLFASVIKYFEHRRSPLMVPISTVVFLLIAGLILIALPLLAYVSQNCVQYKFS
jgi:hypothetical protein